MNRKTRAEERIEALDTSPEALAAAQVEAVRAERDEAVAKAEAERDEYLAALQRERAEFTNFRRRTADERQQERGLAGVDLIAKVLVLADDFDRAIETRPADLDGQRLGRGHRRHRPQAPPAPRERGRHGGRGGARHASSTPASTRPSSAFPAPGAPEGEIVEEVRRGYRLRDRLIRPALVAVAAARIPTRGPGPAS